MRSIVLYLHVHQPFRIRNYTMFDVGQQHNYFDATDNARENNQQILHKVADKSYRPTNEVLLKLLNDHSEFKLSLSISGVLIDQLRQWEPDVLKSFQALTDTGRVEIVGETYHHSLAFFYSRPEFERQVEKHRQLVLEVFNQTPSAFRNTELAYNNEVGEWAEAAGYKAVLAEGWDNVLGWRSPNFVYRAKNTNNLRLLLKNYKLSDDVAFRFGDHDWSEWPLTVDKFCHWLNAINPATNLNLFMDYETFGEHQWQESGIFDFLRALPSKWLETDGNNFLSVSELAAAYQPVDDIDVPHTVTWADTERDLSAWLGNAMQQQSIVALYELEESILASNDSNLIEDWRRLQTSDHFYYMCTKWWHDGDIHAYFSPYDSPYDAHINFMNAWHDMRSRAGVAS